MVAKSVKVYTHSWRKEAPGLVWESDGSGSYTIEDVFREMSAGLPEFSGLTLSRISDLGVQALKIDQSPGPPEEPAEDKVLEREREEATH